MLLGESLGVVFQEPERTIFEAPPSRGNGVYIGETLHRGLRIDAATVFTLHNVASKLRRVLVVVAVRAG
jgi:hypothetical protein